MTFDAAATFGTDRAVVGMVHLDPLPGSPDYDPAGGRAAVRERALADADRLVAGGVDGLLVENHGDAPFHAEEVPPAAVADVTALVGAVDRAVDVPVGVNVLRNDGAAALAVAGATGAAFVRVNVLAGVVAADQGLIEGRAAELLRTREHADVDAAVLADAAVKHATSLDDRPLEREAGDLVARSGADGVVVTGPATGAATAVEDVSRAREGVDAATPDGERAPVFVGSGVTPGNVAETLDVADGVIVGTSLKENGVTDAPVAPDRVADLMAAARAGN